jgi:hypothetical protein
MRKKIKGKNMQGVTFKISHRKEIYKRNELKRKGIF